MSDLEEQDDDDDDDDDVQPDFVRSEDTTELERSAGETSGYAADLPETVSESAELRTEVDEAERDGTLGLIEENSSDLLGTDGEVKGFKTGGFDEAAFPAASHKKRRWTDEEMSLLMQMFGSDIAMKKMPSGQRIAFLSTQICRTIPQIRTQVNNFIKGKLKSK